VPDEPKPPASASRRGVAADLALLIVVAAAPLAVIAALLLYDSAQKELQHSSGIARQIAATTADRAARYVETVRTALEAIAARPQIRAMDAAHCDPNLPDLLQLYPWTGNILVVDLEGRILCGAIPPPKDRVVRIVDEPLLKAMIAEPRFRLSRPLVGRVSKRWSVSAVQPVYADGKRLVGSVSMAIDLLHWVSFEGVDGMPAGTVLTLVTADGTVIGRSAEAESWVGTVRKGPVHQQLLEMRQGSVRASGADGADRLWGFVPVQGTDWFALAGLPAEPIVGPARRRAVEMAVLLAAILAAALALAYSLARNLVRRVRDELRSSEARFSVVVQNSWDVFQLLGPDRRISFVSPSVRRVLGYQPEEQIGRVSAEFVHPEDLPRTAELLKLLLASPGQTLVVQVRVKHKNGSWRWVESSATNLLEHPDVRAVAVNYRDITERKAQQEKIERLNRVYAVLSGINAAIIRIRDRSELFAEACRIAVEQGGFKLAWLGIVERAANQVRPMAWLGAESEYIRSMPLDLGVAGAAARGLAGQAVDERREMICDDMTQDPRITLKAESLARGFRSLIVLPLIAEDEVAGVLCLYAAEIGFFNDEEVKLLRELAGDIAFAMGHIEQEEKLDFLAFYDSLTGLANRTLFTERLNQYLHSSGQSGDKLALVIADVERLRNINDSLGRQAGDALLKTLAGRLAAGADRTELARISADHFAILLRGVKGRSEVTRRFERMWQDCFGARFMMDGTELRISGRAGIALFPNDGFDAETLVRNAEAALRRAKQSGERHVFHAAEMTEHTAEKLTLENRLRQALEKDEFVLHYQPKVDMETRAIVGVEALIRWQSPELGLVPPMKFIPLMEETGIILEAGAWALARAVIDHVRWLDLGLPAPRVAVNVSAVQLRKRDFVATVETALKRCTAPPCIDLEITESLVMEDIQGNIEKLNEARKLGVSIAIDDFGTGYSSLGYLAKLPVQTLKIDRSFIITMLAEADTMTLVSTIISLAHSLKLKVVAEGVDAEEQAKILRLLRCDEMQGYLYSRPVPFDEITAMLRKG
jgi:diguanylate cyclase (GGDEF)-like protein/PAS domain S-box-containing protein